jgi:type IV pilus assembly protein PilW
MRAPLSSPFLRHKGFSLVELMISLALGGLIIAAVGTVYLGSRQSFRTQDAMARMQEGARYAFELMTFDIRQAGFTECAPKSKTYSTLNGTDWFNNLATQPLFGYESGAGLPAAVAGELANTDALRILRADSSGDFRVASHNGSAASFQLVANHNLKQGEILTVVPPDCSKAVTFQMSNVNNNNTIDVVVHNTGVGAPGNSTKCLDDPAGTLCSSPSTYPDLPADSKIMRMSGNIYFIRNNPNNIPSLYRLHGTDVNPEEMVEGVEDMQITYGEDTSQASLPDCPDDVCSADVYVDADDVINWNRVVSVRLTLGMLTPETGVGAGGDGRIHKTFTTTIAVRNRL